MQTMRFFICFMLFCACGQKQNEIKTQKPLKSITVIKEVLTKKGIDSVLTKFTKHKFKDLNKAYREYSDPEGKFRKRLDNMYYYQIEFADLNTCVVGKYKVRDFVAPDKYFQESMMSFGRNGKIYWLVDKQMLYMFLELILKLDENGYDKYGYSIRNSHRHPLWNKSKWKGARNSQHIYGRAVDLRAGDVNKDGKANMQDKKIMLALLEKIVGNKGGLGLYPESMCLHFDCRGFRARWNHQ